MDLQFGFTYVIAYFFACDVTYVIAYVITYVITCVIAYVITYPYAWTVYFEMRLDMQLRTYQPPIPNTSQASAWSYKYI